MWAWRLQPAGAFNYPPRLVGGLLACECSAKSSQHLKGNHSSSPSTPSTQLSTVHKTLSPSEAPSLRFPLFGHVTPQTTWIQFEPFLSLILGVIYDLQSYGNMISLTQRVGGKKQSKGLKAPTFAGKTLLLTQRHMCEEVQTHP